MNSENKVLDLLYLKKSLNDCNELETKYINDILNIAQMYEKICFVDGIKPDFCLRTGEKRIKIKKRFKEKEQKLINEKFANLKEGTIEHRKQVLRFQAANNLNRVVEGTELNEGLFNITKSKLIESNILKIEE